MVRWWGGLSLRREGDAEEGKVDGKGEVKPDGEEEGEKKEEKEEREAKEREERRERREKKT